MFRSARAKRTMSFAMNPANTSSRTSVCTVSRVSASGGSGDCAFAPAIRTTNSRTRLDTTRMGPPSKLPTDVRVPRFRRGAPKLSCGPKPRSPTMPNWSTVVCAAALMLFTVSTGGSAQAQSDVFDRVTHGTAVSEGGVKIHYASLGKGPLVVMIHGFPDFWYSWRHQMAALSDRYQVVAIDQRGYNLSDKPAGQDKYDMSFLVSDLRAVVRHFTNGKAVVVGHRSEER